MRSELGTFRRQRVCRRRSRRQTASPLLGSARITSPHADLGYLRVALHRFEAVGERAIRPVRVKDGILGRRDDCDHIMLDL